MTTAIRHPELRSLLHEQQSLGKRKRDAHVNDFVDVLAEFSEEEAEYVSDSNTDDDDDEEYSVYTDEEEEDDAEDEDDG